MPARKPRKVTPLRTVSQLKADLLLREEELETARASIRALQTELSMANIDKTRASIRLVSLLTDIRNAVNQHDEVGQWNISAHLCARLVPRSFAKWVISATKATVWGRIVEALGQYQEAQHIIEVKPEPVKTEPVVTDLTEEKTECFFCKEDNHDLCAGDFDCSCFNDNHAKG